MSWLILAFLDVIADSFRIFIDNYSADVFFKKRGAVSQKLFYGWAYIIIASIILIVMQFNFSTVALTTIGLIITAGILASIAGIPYYRALELDDSTNVGIFIQLAPVIYLILGFIFLGQTFSLLQIIAFFIILSAPLIIILTTRKRSRKIRIHAVFYALLYVIIAVTGNLLFVQTNNNSGLAFPSAMSFYLIGKGLGNILTVYCVPKWRRRFKSVVKTSHGKVFRPLFANLIVITILDFAYRGVLILAPSVAIASVATDSVVPIAIFFLGILLSIIWPKFGREKLDKKTVVVHLIATILVVTGVILLQI